MLGQFRRILRKVRERDQKLLLIMAQKLYQKSERAGRKSKTHDSATT